MAKDWKETIRGLLNKAEDSATADAERDAINERVTYLMAKFGIEQSMIDATAKKVYKVIRVPYAIRNPYKNQRMTLLNGIGAAFGCKVIQLQNSAEVFGHEDDQEKVFLLYSSLELQMASALSKAQAHKPLYEHGRTFNTSFINAYVNTVISRVLRAYRKAQQDVAETTTGTDLVLRDRKMAVDSMFSAAYPLTRSVVASKSANSFSGIRAGEFAARNANIGQTGLAGGRRAING